MRLATLSDLQTKDNRAGQIMARTRLQYTIIVACMVITTLFIIHEVLNLNGFSRAPQQTAAVALVRSGHVLVKPVATVGVSSDIRTKGGSWNRSDGCHRLWIKGQSQWFDERFNFSLSPLWTLANRNQEPHIKRWWLTLQNSQEALLDKSLNELFDLIPTGDPYGMRDLTRCLRCAVVGNSGNLRGSKYGKLIDSHNMVFRINKAKVKGFEEDVGAKESHRIMYPESLVDLGNETHFVLAAFKVRDIEWMKSALTDGSISRTYMQVKRKITTDKSMIMVFNPALLYQIHKTWENGEGRYPSTGAMTVFLAMHMCDEVNVFGFGPTKNGNWDHYWEPGMNDEKVDAFRKTGVHSGDTEKEIWQQLEREGKIKLYLGTR